MVGHVAPVPDVSRLHDPEDFRVFYADALPRVYGYFLLRCGAEIALAERGSTVETPGSWILGIARHKLLDHFRRQRRIGWSTVSWESTVEEHDEALLVPEDDDASRDQAIATLALVPLMQREALVLRYLDGLSVAEVASLLQRSVSATESLLARGRASFRQGFEEARDA